MTADNASVLKSYMRAVIGIVPVGERNAVDRYVVEFPQRINKHLKIVTAVGKSGGPDEPVALCVVLARVERKPENI